MFVNKKEKMPLTLMDGLVVAQAEIVKIENLNDEFKNLTYGVIIDKTMLTCKTTKAS
jgi:hypothetical protein